MMIAKSELATVLRALINSHDLTESELARQTNIGQPVVHRLLSGETTNPKIETLKPIANHFGISVNQLIGDEPLPKNLIHRSAASHLRTWIQVPLLTSEQAVLLPEIEMKDEATAQTFIATDCIVSDNAYALVIHDSTMMPRFPEGTVVIVDPAYHPVDRDFAIIHIEGNKHVTFRQVLIDGENVYLKPLNSDFGVMQLTKSYRFLGVVVQARTDYIPGEVRRANS